MGRSRCTPCSTLESTELVPLDARGAVPRSTQHFRHSGYDEYPALIGNSSNLKTRGTVPPVTIPYPGHPVALSNRLYQCPAITSNFKEPQNKGYSWVTVPLGYGPPGLRFPSSTTLLWNIFATRDVLPSHSPHMDTSTPFSPGAYRSPRPSLQNSPPSRRAIQ